MTRVAFALTIGLVSIFAFSQVARAGDQADAGMIESYTARLGANDHYNSKGERLTTAAAIIRQDRANFHKFALQDPEDQPDTFFVLKSNRALLEKMLSAGSASRETLNRIINSQPLIHVRVYNDYVDITVE